MQAPNPRPNPSPLPGKLETADSTFKLREKTAKGSQKAFKDDSLNPANPYHPNQLAFSNNVNVLKHAEPRRYGAAHDPPSQAPYCPRLRPFCARGTRRAVRGARCRAV